MKKILWIAALAGLLTGAVAQAAVYTWTGANSGDWYTTAYNWANTDGSVNASPHAASTAGVGNTSDLVINNSVNLSQFTRIAPLIIKSLTYGADADGDHYLGLMALNLPTNDRDLTFSAASGNASITVLAGSTGNKTIGMQNAATSTAGEVILASDLDITHNGSGLLTFAKGIEGSTAGRSVSIAGAGLTVYSGLNTYSGNTTLDAASTLTLSDNAQLAFTIGANGVNNALLGSGTLNLNGDFNISTTTAGTTVGDTWQLVASNLNEAYGSTFSVVGWTAVGSDKWQSAVIDGGTKYYEFSESTGALAVIPEPATIGMLGLGAIITVLIRRMRA